MKINKISTLLAVKALKFFIIPTETIGMGKSFLFLSYFLISHEGFTKDLQRRMASSALRPPELIRLLEASETILADVANLSQENCVPYLSELEKSIDALDVTKLPRQELFSDAKTIAKNSAKARFAIHAKLSELGERCANQAQSSFRQLRFVEDYLLELVNKVEHKVPEDIDWKKIPIPMFDNPSFYSVQLKNSGPAKFESGDILITRGVSFLSAMIARMGDRNAQFSHIVMMNRGSNGVMRTLESYVGSGVGFYELHEALKNENARIFWIRAKDKDLAQKASRLMAEEVEKRPKGDHIKYDYELNFKEATTMSCAEVSQVAFLKASDNKFRIPLYPNRITGGQSLMKRLKIPKGEIYSPGDMEIDPRFEVLGEFTDLRLTRDSRQKDAIMTKVYEWMDKKDYVLKDNFNSRMANGPLFYARKTPLWPVIQRTFKIKDFSEEIPKNMLSSVSLINDLGDVLVSELKKKDAEFERKYGIPMTYMDFYRTLEQIREEDLAVYKNKKTREQAKFHQVFRPKKIK